MRRALVLVAVLAFAACEETTRIQSSPSVRPSEIVAPTARATTTATATTAPSATPTRTATTAPTTAAGSPSPSPVTTSAPSPSPAPTTTTPQGAAPALGSCADEGRLRPELVAPDATVPIVFSNQSGGQRDVLSLDAQGRRVLARSLASGTSYTQTAHIGDVWVMSTGGSCVALYRVTAAALVISQASRQSIVPLYAIAGIITDARTGNAASGQTVTIWQPEASACASEAGAVVSSITGGDGTYRVWVTPGTYKIRVRTTAAYAPQWWSSRLDCASATAVDVTGDTFQVSFRLQPQ